MKVESKHVIGDKIVTFVVEFCGIKVYRSDNADEEINLYFVKNDEVVKTLKIEADYGRNMGYISKCEFVAGYTE